MLRPASFRMPFFQRQTEPDTASSSALRRPGGPHVAAAAAGRGLSAPPPGANANTNLTPTLDQVFFSLTRGICGASMCAILLVSTLIASLPLPFFAAWLLSPPVLDKSYPLVFDYRLPEPTATTVLSPSKAAPKWEPINATAELEPGKRVVLQGQRFNVMLHLRLPESEHNMNLGVFQVSALALSPTGQVLASTSIPCTVHYTSIPRRVIRATLLAVPMMLGLVNEIQDLDLDLFKGVAGSTPLTSIKVILHPAAGAPARTGLPQVFSARLRVKTLYWGSSLWLALWPLSSFVWIMGLVCCCQALGTCLCFNLFFFPSLGALSEGFALLTGSSPPPGPHAQAVHPSHVPTATPLTSPAAPAASHIAEPPGSLPSAPPISRRTFGLLGAYRGLGTSEEVEHTAESRLAGQDATSGRDRDRDRDRHRDREEGIQDEVESTGSGAVSSEQESEDEEVERVLEVVKNTLGSPSSASAGAGASRAGASTGAGAGAGATASAGAAPGSGSTAAVHGVAGRSSAADTREEGVAAEGATGRAQAQGDVPASSSRGIPLILGGHAERFGQRPVSAGGLRQRRGEVVVEDYKSEGGEEEEEEGQDGDWLLAAPGGAEYARSPEHRS